jgi:hypothetical protein
MKNFTNKQLKDIEKTVREHLFSIVGKAYEFGWGDYLSGEDGELEGILPKKIETKIESIDVPRHRDGEWGEDMNVNLVTGQTITIKLSDLERGMCKAHYAYKYIENVFSHQCN